ncbi:MAG: hypothetical protein WCJ56_14945 [bacterium]
MKLYKFSFRMDIAEQLQFARAKIHPGVTIAAFSAGDAKKAFALLQADEEIADKYGLDYDRVYSCRELDTTYPYTANFVAKRRRLWGKHMSVIIIEEREYQQTCANWVGLVLDI